MHMKIICGFHAVLDRFHSALEAHGVELGRLSLVRAGTRSFFIVSSHYYFYFQALS